MKKHLEIYQADFCQMPPGNIWDSMPYHLCIGLAVSNSTDGEHLRNPAYGIDRRCLFELIKDKEIS